MENNNSIINFALLLKHDSNKYEKVNEFIENCKNKVPFTSYYGSIKKENIQKIKKAAEYFNLGIFIQEDSLNHEYNFIFIKHKIVYSKDFFIHFNPIERIQLSKKVLKREINSEWNDPRIVLNIEDFNLKDYIFAPKKVENYQIPIELKMQLGILFQDKEEQGLFMEDFIDNLQNEIEENDTNFYECEFTRQPNI